MKVFIGYDPREDVAAQVCRHSLEKYGHDVVFLTKELVKDVYDRPWKTVNGQRVDLRDGKPFSTEFSFTRFLVPHLMDYDGWALFCDCDFLFLEDPEDLVRCEDFAAMVVKHNHVPVEAMKMDGCMQTVYPRKNWSSLVLWNCGHPQNRTLTPKMVNTMDGSFLHGFHWLSDKHIGGLPEEWNWLAGTSPTTFKGAATPKAIHYTEGGPWFDGYGDCPFADEWVEAHEEWLNGG